ncbi:GTP-binding DUF697 domain-containing protein [Desulfobotulus sp. H1]|uniref:GTP-binding DUF697 domain-containing protein n=1 Tax=Desulfobotulus pelophilus TaxID=2823377 RepID=A0ABT3N9H3_9BACT|nr:GTPase [Desulfobotulus pelophilus]MCW7754117.1 GTP-binding DUF697 domain-containing protein [Desulfobotulus pelophilus]
MLLQQSVQKLASLMFPEKNPELKPAFQYSREHLPTLWLLGKTGAGKSSLIQAVTGLDGVEVGNGFRPCTPSSRRYVFPPDKPLMAFLDTRGLAEADYDPYEDIRACSAASHALIVVMRAEDPEQSEVLRALEQIRASGSVRDLLLVHTGIELVDTVDERQRCIRHNRDQVERVWGLADQVAVDFVGREGFPSGIGDLVGKLQEHLPVIAALFEKEMNAGVEEENFLRLKKDVMWYAGAAAATDAVPGLGFFAVPAIQSKMLHSLAGQYGLEWNRTLLRDFFGAMGAGFAVQYAAAFGRRQLVKLIPVYGQIIGGVSAGVASYGFTYAMGRVACMYFYGKSSGDPPSPEEMRERFDRVFARMTKVMHDENK